VASWRVNSEISFAVTGLLLPRRRFTFMTLIFWRRRCAETLASPAAPHLAFDQLAGLVFPSQR